MESISQNLICTHGTNIKEIYCDLDTAFKNDIMNTLVKAFGIKITFCIQSMSKILLHYMVKYGNKWCIFYKAITFCLNTLSIAHLQNISDIQVQSDYLTKPQFYHFADWFFEWQNKCYKIDSENPS